MPTPLVTYRAQTPEPDNRLPETSEAFVDADEDLRPLTGNWVDIMDQEIQEGTAVTSTAPEVTWALGAPTAAASTVMTTATMALSAPIPTPVLDLAGDRSASPTVIASTPGTSQPELAAPTTTAPETAAPPEAAPLASTASIASTDTRPVLRYSDIAYTVRLSRAGQADLVADSTRQIQEHSHAA